MIILDHCHHSGGVCSSASSSGCSSPYFNWFLITVTLLYIFFIAFIAEMMWAQNSFHHLKTFILLLSCWQRKDDKSIVVKLKHFGYPTESVGQATPLSLPNLLLLAVTSADMAWGQMHLRRKRGQSERWEVRDRYPFIMMRANLLHLHQHPTHPDSLGAPLELLLEWRVLVEGSCIRSTERQLIKLQNGEVGNGCR